MIAASIYLFSSGALRLQCGVSVASGSFHFLRRDLGATWLLKDWGGEKLGKNLPLLAGLNLRGISRKL